MSTNDPVVPGPTSQPRLRLSDFLPYRLNVAAAVVSEGLARTYSERFGISVHEWRILATVGEFGSITAKAIGEHAHMSKVNVSRAAASLETKKLIRRSPNPQDKREAFLVFTPAGKSLYDRIVPLARAYVDSLHEGWSPDEKEMLFRLLDRLVERAAGSTASLTQMELAPDFPDREDLAPTFD
jgi:DNA-binding MarR family transcriptional regulator